MDPKQTICTLRWDYPIINFGRSEARLCCRTPGKRISKEEIEKHGTNVFLNNDFQIERRLEMLKGIRHKDCASCWKLEDNGMQSPRIPHSHENFVYQMLERGVVSQEEASKYSDFSEWAKTVTIDHPVLKSYYPNMLEISLGNFCDMKCMYCNHHYSTQWASEAIKYGEIRQDQYDREFPEGDPQYEELFWKWFNETGKHSLDRIGIIGGEPLIMPKFYEFIERLYDSYADMPEKKKKVSLWIVTNLNTPKLYFEKFQQFMPRITEFFKLEIHASMESMGPQAEYIRNGVNWKRFESNVRSLLDSDYEMAFGFQMAVNALNIPHFKEYLMWIKSLHDTYDKPITLKQNVISFPDWQSPLILTPDFADYLDDTIIWLNSIKDEMKLVNDDFGQWSKYPEFLSGIANGIRNSRADNEKRRKFYTWFKMYDQRRDINFLETFPHHTKFWELCKSLEENNQ
jgi:hypothetical protein